MERPAYQFKDLQISREKRKLARRKQYEEALIQTKQKEALAPIKQLYTDTCTALRNDQKALNEYLNAAKKIANNSSSSFVFDGKSPANCYQKSDYGEYFLEDGANEGVGSSFKLKSDYTYDSETKQYLDKDGLPYIPTYKEDGSAVQYYDKVFDADKYAQIVSKYNLKSLSDIQYGDSVSDIESQINTELNQINTALQSAYTDYIGNQENEKQIYENELEMLEEDTSEEETLLDEEQIEVETQLESITQELEAITQALSSNIQQDTIKLS